MHEISYETLALVIVLILSNSFCHILWVRFKCKKAKRLNQPICDCWDCKDKCNLFRK